LKGSFFTYTTSVNTEALRLNACLGSELGGRIAIEVSADYVTLHVLPLDKCQAKDGSY